MINNSINSHFNGYGKNSYGASTSATKTSVNKYYNIFSKKLEEIELPNIDLEFNSPFDSDKSTFLRVA